MSNLEPQLSLNEFFKTYREYTARAIARRDEWANLTDGANYLYEQRAIIEFMIDMLKRIENLESILNVGSAEKAAIVTQLSKNK